jgi:YceI-like domain
MTDVSGPAAGVAAAATVAALRRGVLLALCCLALAACRTTPPPPPPPPVAPPPVSMPEVLKHYRIDAERSQVLVLVYRDGPMAKLGHNHVLAVHGLAGEVILLSDATDASFRLEFPVAAMSIDEPALRAEQGEEFSAKVDAASIEGTRGHMLGEQLLEANRFPLIRVQSHELRPEGDHWMVHLHISVRDHECSVEVPVVLSASAEELTAAGEFDLTHALLGLTPYSVGLGALRVAETIHIRYRLFAARQRASGTAPEQP